MCFEHVDFESCFAPQPLCKFSTAYRLPAKVLWTRGAFKILTWKRALRHNGVHFFNTSTSKSAPTLLCLQHFDFKTCFAPRWRAIFDLSYDQMASHPPKTLEKQSVSRLSYHFRAPAFFFFWLFLFSDLLSSSFLFSDSSHLYFSICPCCRKFDSWTSFDHRMIQPLDENIHGCCDPSEPSQWCMTNPQTYHILIVEW